MRHYHSIPPRRHIVSGNSHKIRHSHVHIFVGIILLISYNVHGFQIPSQSSLSHIKRRSNRKKNVLPINVFLQHSIHEASDFVATTASIIQHHTNIIGVLPDTLELPSGKDVAEKLSPENLPQLPFSKLADQLRNELDIGASLKDDTTSKLVNEQQTSLVLESIGRDLLIFLLASVIVTPIANLLGVTPILGYLFLGAWLGPNGLDFFANSKADVELGDFGILFLLFSEGLEVTKSRLNQLTQYLPLAFAQISLCAGVLSWGIVNWSNLERYVPLDDGLINVSQPMEALVLALALTLSTSAFVFPVLNEREWEDNSTGQAATSILLLQDLAVAPLLVTLPYIVGQKPPDYEAILFLTAKAVIGFGSIIFLGSIMLRKIFAWVAETRSTETFVALCLLVSIGMGTIAKALGLTDTAGAFAAGVLLANTNYRAQIQADILPFKGILLGIFFMVAGSSFDFDLCIQELPTVATGVFALITLKAVTLFVATRVPEVFEPNRLQLPDAVRLSFLLSGGGEFAFVVLALAERLKVLPEDLGGLLTAIVLITMAVTPLLGELADFASRPLLRFDSANKKEQTNIIYNEKTEIAKDAIIVCGYGDIGSNVVRVLGDEYEAIRRVTSPEDCDIDMCAIDDLPQIVAFDNNPLLVDSILIPNESSVVLYGDGSNPAVIASSGVKNPSTIFVTYENSALVSSTTARLRAVFPETSIFARAQTRTEAQALKSLGATEVTVELDELPRSAAAMVWGGALWDVPSNESVELMATSGDNIAIRQAAAVAARVPLSIIDQLLKMYKCIDTDLSGLVDAKELMEFIRKSNSGIASDDEIQIMEDWIKEDVLRSINSVGFCQLYVRAPPLIKRALNDSCKEMKASRSR